MSDFDFEKAITRLEEINEQLASGDESLDKSMKLFEEGLQLIQKSDKKLKGFDQSIIDLKEKYQGE